MRTIDANRRGVTNLGKYDENIVTVVRFDVSVFNEEYAGCNIYLTHRRSQDKVGMPVGSFEVIEDTGYWTVTAGDLAYPGLGQAELHVMVGDAHRKSITYSTVVMESSTGSCQTPAEPIKGWVDKVLEAAEHVQHNVQWDDIFNKPETFTPSPHEHDADEITYTIKDDHTPGSVGEWLAKHCRILVADEGDLPAIEAKYRGFFAFQFGDKSDRLYAGMKRKGNLEWVLLHETEAEDVYDKAYYDVAIFN